MNPEGMILLLNYREDGTTRAHPPLTHTLPTLNPGSSSVFHHLERRCEGNQVVARSQCTRLLCSAHGNERRILLEPFEIGQLREI